VLERLPGEVPAVRAAARLPSDRAQLLVPPGRPSLGLAAELQDVLAVLDQPAVGPPLHLVLDAVPPAADLGAVKGQLGGVAILDPRCPRFPAARGDVGVSWRVP
jgi:hypothetical protein